MRIPASAIVMTLLIAVPFGFAVRDTLRGDDAQTRTRRAEVAERAAAQKRHDDEIAEEQAGYERAKQLDAERARAYATLLGKEPAALGERFAGAQVGTKVSLEVEGELGRVDALLDVARAGLQLHGDARIASVSFTFGETHCEAVRAALTAAWGPAPSDAELWIDRAHHRRASLGGLLCVLHFDSITDDDSAWVRAALPGLIGKTPAQAVKRLGAPTVPLDEPTLSWFLPGPPRGRDSTELTADVLDGKIVRTRAVATVTRKDALALVAMIAKQLGEPGVGNDGGDAWTWPRTRIRVELDDASRLAVVTE